jgi:hypothetical protein
MEGFQKDKNILQDREYHAGASEMDSIIKFNKSTYYTAKVARYSTRQTRIFHMS